MPEEMMNEREKMAETVCDMIHDSARIIRTAIISEDESVKKTMKEAAKIMIDTAIKKMDDSVGTSVADEEDE